jgi:two-component system sensor histidine kinase SenX3
LRSEGRSGVGALRAPFSAISSEWAGLAPADEHAVVEVTDSGTGIAVSDQERVFERFFRVDSARSRATGGTGLGLSIVRHVMHHHGGRAEVESVSGHGSTFRLYFPQ